MWIGQLFKHKLLVTVFQFITGNYIISRVKQEVCELEDLSFQVLHCCVTTVISEACPTLHTDSAARGQANTNDVVKAHVSTMLLEPRVVKTTANRPLIGAQDWMFASLIATWKSVLLQGLMKVQVD